ncbi:MAG: DUF1569 domain-containing protein [Deltaproteobacteria bacterium]|nr:DUF1569 domain-containing protein [Deltaproteobacteria bacterium]
MHLKLSSLAEAAEAVARLRGAPNARLKGGEWPLARVLNHCALSLDCSRTGFPVMKPVLVRRTVGPLVLRIFLARGRMRHDHLAAIPGDLDGLKDSDPAKAVDRLLRSIADFQAHKGTLAEHFVYGRLTKDQGDRIQAMHIADHLSALEID